MRVDIFHYCGPNTGAQQAGLRQRSSCHKQFNAAGHRRDAMATERLHAAQERLAELVNSRDACIAFAAGSVLGSASAALAVFWLQRREQTRHQPAAAAAAVCKASGLRAVLDIDEGLAVGAPPGPDKGSHTGAANLYHFCTATGSSQRRVQAQALADVLARCPEIREDADAALASATGVLAGRWLGCAWFPLRYDLSGIIEPAAFRSAPPDRRQTSRRLALEQRALVATPDKTCGDGAEGGPRTGLQPGLANGDVHEPSAHAATPGPAASQPDADGAPPEAAASASGSEGEEAAAGAGPPGAAASAPAASLSASAAPSSADASAAPGKPSAFAAASAQTAPSAGPTLANGAPHREARQPPWLAGAGGRGAAPGAAGPGPEREPGAGSGSGLGSGVGSGLRSPPRRRKPWEPAPQPSRLGSAQRYPPAARTSSGGSAAPSSPRGAPSPAPSPLPTPLATPRPTSPRGSADGASTPRLLRAPSEASSAAGGGGGGGARASTERARQRAAVLRGQSGTLGRAGGGGGGGGGGGAAPGSPARSTASSRGSAFWEQR